MLRNKTVLILGAGASATFGFPTGRELVRRIIRVEKKDVPEGLNGLLCPAVFEKLEITNDDLMVQLQKALLRSQVDSIDEFLAKPRNVRYSELGRFLIAAFVAPKEDPEVLTSLDPHEPNWYRLIRPHLCDYPSIEALRDQKHLSIVTFNYDRSFEQYFYYVLRQEYAASITQICGLFEDMVFHVHGSFGSLNVRDKANYLPYRPNTNVDDLIRATKRIKIMHEVNEVPSAAAIRARLQDASRIIFLGCHYHADNLRKILGLLSLKHHPDLTVQGSTFGLTQAECEDAKYRISEALTITTDRIDISTTGNLKCHDYVRHFVRFT